MGKYREHPPPESQRDSIPQPRVASPRATLGPRSIITPSTLKGLHPVPPVTCAGLASNVARVREDRHSGVGPIQHMVEIPTFCGSLWTTHARKLRERPSAVNNRFLTPFLPLNAGRGSR